jgi:gamma-glutamylcyclotransferase (GGCT)/AIG2-like uncharacterized protein YtfP
VGVAYRSGVGASNAVADPDPSLPLAVYGTLRRGFRNHALLGDRAAWAGPATLHGQLRHVGAGRRPYPYPGFVPGPDGLVVAELLRVVDVGLWGDLHALEAYDPSDPAGSEYVLVEVEALTSHGPRQPCLTYAYNREPSHWPRIPAGDWARVSPSPSVRGCPGAPPGGK